MSEYFDNLISQPQYFKGFSMRPVAGRQKLYPPGHQFAGKVDPYYEKQIASKLGGGYCQGDGVLVSYDPTKDAAKISIPAWSGSTTLKSPISATGTEIQVQVPDGWERGTGLLIDDEILEVAEVTTAQSPDGTGGRFMLVKRGMVGSIPADHAQGAVVKRKNNSVWSGSQVRFPIATREGHSYFITVEFMMDSVFVPSPHDYWKFIQLSSGPGDDKIWCELQLRMLVSSLYTVPGYVKGRDVGVTTCRYYGSISTNPSWVESNGSATGSAARKAYGITKQDPILPMADGGTHGGFLVQPLTRTRVFYHFRPVVQDWDLMTVYLADETQEPKIIYQDLKLSAGNPGMIEKLWLELNTSQQEATRPWQQYGSPANLPPLVCWFRDLAVLEDVADITPYLLKPIEDGGTAPGTTPSAPANLRLA